MSRFPPNFRLVCRRWDTLTKTTSSPLTKRQLIENVGALLSGTAFARLLSALVLILIARSIGPDGFGVYAASFAFVRLTSVAFALGLDGWLLAVGFKAGAMHLLSVHSTTGLAIRAILGLIWIAAVALIAPFLNPDVFPVTVVILSATIVWLEELGRMVWSTFKTALQNRVTFVLLTTSQALILIVVWTVIDRGVESVVVILLAQLTATAVGTALALFWFARTVRIHFEPQRVRGTLRATIPFAISMALALIYGRADITIVGQWLGAEAAGFYSPAISLVSAMILVPSAIYGVMLPALSRVRDRARFLRISKQFTAASLLLGLVLAVTVALLAPYLVPLLFGDEYRPTIPVLAVLSGVLLARSVIFPVAAMLVAVGWQSRRVVAQAVAAALNIGLNLLVIQRYGIVSVAVVYVITEWVLLGGYLLLLWRAQRVGALKPIVAAS